MQVNSGDQYFRMIRRVTQQTNNEGLSRESPKGIIGKVNLDSTQENRENNSEGWSGE